MRRVVFWRCVRVRSPNPAPRLSTARLPATDRDRDRHRPGTDADADADTAPTPPTPPAMDAPEDRDVKLQKVSGDLLTQFGQRLPELLQPADSEGGRRRRKTVDSLIALVRLLDIEILYSVQYNII